MRTTGAALLGAGAITVVGGLTTQLLDSSVSDNVYSSPYSSSAFVVVCVIRGVLHGTLTLTEAATLVGVALIQLWWAISFMAGARGNGSGVASAGILGAGWAALTNGFPIVYCPPVCEEARPLTDLGHVGSIVFGILLALVAIWSLWRARARPGWFMPAVAAALVVGTVVSLANTPIT